MSVNGASSELQLACRVIAKRSDPEVSGHSVANCGRKDGKDCSSSIRTAYQTVPHRFQMSRCSPRTRRCCCSRTCRRTARTGRTGRSSGTSSPGTRRGEPRRTRLPSTRRPAHPQGRRLRARVHCTPTGTPATSPWAGPRQWRRQRVFSVFN